MIKDLEPLYFCNQIKIKKVKGLIKNKVQWADKENIISVLKQQNIFMNPHISHTVCDLHNTMGLLYIVY